MVTTHLDHNAYLALRLTSKHFLSIYTPIQMHCVFLARRKESHSSIVQLCKNPNFQRHRLGVSELVLDILSFDDTSQRDIQLLRTQFEQDNASATPLRVITFNTDMAKWQYHESWRQQENFFTRWRLELGNAIKRLPNVTTLTFTDEFPLWYFTSGTIAKDVTFSPWPRSPRGSALAVQLNDMLRVLAMDQSLSAGALIRRLAVRFRYSITGGIPYDMPATASKRAHLVVDSAPDAFRYLRDVALDISTSRYRKPRAKAQTRISDWSIINELIAAADQLRLLTIRLRGPSIEPEEIEALFSGLTCSYLTSLRLHNFMISMDLLRRLLLAHRGTLRTLAPGVIGLVASSWVMAADDLKNNLTNLEAVYLLCIQDDAGWDWTDCTDSPCRRADYEAALLDGRPNKWDESEQMLNHRIERIFRSQGET